nr:transcription initiation factor TFIID subunit 1-like [Leptinotarsa decemlineata]
MSVDSEDESSILTGFLFGNIDEAGNFENEFFDSNERKQLVSLGKLGLGSFMEDILSDETLKEEIESDFETYDVTHIKQTGTGIENFGLQGSLPSEVYMSQDSQNEGGFSREHSSRSSYSGQSGYHSGSDVELPFAEDFFDMTELANEEAGCINEDYDADDETPNEYVKLMPTQKIPVIKVSLEPNSSQVVVYEADNGNKKFETPLAAVPSSKYSNIDVTELFPDFRRGKVLRFSRLFGPDKPSSLPKIWENVRKEHEAREHKGKLRDTDSNSGVEKPRHKGWLFDYADPKPELLMSDDEEKFLKPAVATSAGNDQNMKEKDDSDPNAAGWRFGPAQLWYDMLGVPETGEGFNYGFKMKDRPDSESVVEITDENEPLEKKQDQQYPDDAFLMVSQTNWEDDVIWDGDEIKRKVLQTLSSKTNAAGWIPCSGTRTAPPFSQSGEIGTSAGMPGQEQDDTRCSMFPVENEELVYGRWEDDVIWDADDMKKIPKPSILTLDPNDENIIFGIPDDIDPFKQIAGQATSVENKNSFSHIKKSMMLLEKAGVINVLQEDSFPPPPRSPDRDPFNISNDKYYQPINSEKALTLKVAGANSIQHSIPVLELRAPFIQTHMDSMTLRNFHRPAMKRFLHGPLSRAGPHGVMPLMEHIKTKAKEREAEKKAIGGVDVFSMRTPEDLTGRDGELILVEFCEEYPPLMNQVGMCSIIKNYYKRKAGKDSGPPTYRYGETVYARTSPFLGVLLPGQSIQAIENNMYRAPLYEHNIPETDFIVIRTRRQYYIREMDSIYLAGQQCPLYEVPAPNSKKANHFVRDFLQVFIYRLFWRSKDIPRKIKLDDIKRVFSSYSEYSIRKGLKLCANFKRTSMDSKGWVIKSEFTLPTEEEIRAMVSPEQCCAYFSMIAAKQRLKDAGYAEKFTSAEDDDEEIQSKMEDEVKVAPWNTTRAYIQAVNGKCLLQLTGPADPTGCGEGFSYVRVTNKPTQNKEHESQPKRAVTGRLSVNKSKALVRNFGVPEEDNKELSRWEIVDVLRTLSTEKVKAGGEGIDKFSRCNKLTIADENQERYKKECQRIFDLQNRVLACADVLSTDEGESSEDIEEMGKKIEDMLINKKTSTREEYERQELRKIMESDKERPEDKKKFKEVNYGQRYPQGRVLRIVRTLKTPEGEVYHRQEIVRNQAVIDFYVKIRKSKDEAFIRQFANLNEAEKEELKKEKRKIQDKLKRIKKIQEKVGMAGGHVQTTPVVSLPSANSMENLSKPIKCVSAPVKPTSSKSTTSSPLKSSRKSKHKTDSKCGVCGNVGHKRTSRACPLYQNTTGMSTPMNVAMTDKQKICIGKQLNTDDEEMKHGNSMLKVPRNDLYNKKRPREISDSHCEGSAKWRRTVSVVRLSNLHLQKVEDSHHDTEMKIFEDLALSESDDEVANIPQEPMQGDYDAGAIWF